MTDENNSENLKAELREVLAKLTAKEAKILRENFGINLSSNISHEEVTKQFDVVRERIEQIEKSALKKLARKKELESLPKCSFCKLRSDQVKLLIAAPEDKIFICDECVRECLKVLDAQEH